MTYPELLVRLAKTLVNDPMDDDLLAVLPRFIEDAENRIYRELDPMALRTTVALPIATSVASYTLPADCLTARSLRLTAPLGSTTRRLLARRDDAYLDVYAPDPAVQGTPKYWSQPTEDTIRLAPTPSTGFPCELLYSARPLALSASTPSTWLSETYGDLLFAAVMCSAAAYQRDYGAASDDPKAALSWEAAYAARMASAQTDEGRRRLASTSLVSP